MLSSQGRNKIDPCLRRVTCGMEQANKKAQASASERGFILKLPADEPNKAAEVLGMTNTATALSKGCRQRMGYGKAVVSDASLLQKLFEKLQNACNVLIVMITILVEETLSVDIPYSLDMLCFRNGDLAGRFWCANIRIRLLGCRAGSHSIWVSSFFCENQIKF
jgi:hypothetical protein